MTDQGPSTPPAGRRRGRVGEAQLTDRVSSGTRDRIRQFAPVVVLVVVAGAVGLLTVRPSPGQPLDPTSTSPDGTKALVDVLEGLGADVTVAGGVPSAASDTVLLLVDNLDEPTRGRFEAYAEGGGTLVVTDASSLLAPEVVGTTTPTFLDRFLALDCDVDALAGADRLVAPQSPTYDVPPGATGCYSPGEGHWLVARPVGEGTIVSVGDPGFLTNGLLGEADNAVLAAALLAPAPEEATVTVVPPDFTPEVAAADQGLADLIPRRVRLALLQLLLAFGVVVLWRFRRLGRPVTESQQVQLPGSGLVVALGNLLQQAGARGRAAQLIRDDVRRHLGEVLGVSRDATPERVAAAAAHRSRLSADEVLAVLDSSREPSDIDLVRLAQRADRLRAAVSVQGARPADAPIRAGDEPSQDPSARPDPTGAVRV